MPVIKHGSGATSAFKTVKVSGQSDVVADDGSDDLTLAAGSNVTITTNAGTDTVTIAASGGGAALDGIDDQSSSNDDQITITDTEVVINDDSDDLDFRVESDGNANMLFVDGGTDTVGIGTATPGLNLAASTGDVTGTVLHVKGTSGRGGLVVEGQTGARLDLVDITGGSDTKWMRLDVADNVTKFHSVDDNAAAFNTDNIMVMDLDTGNIGFSDESGDDKITIDGEVALKEQSSAPSATADYSKIYAKEYGNDSNTILLLTGDGTNDAQTFTDSSAGGTTHSFAAGGDQSGWPKTVTGTKKFGTASMSFNGVDEQCVHLSTTHSDFDLGTSDFTMDGWFNFNSPLATQYMFQIGTATAGLTLLWSNSGYLVSKIASASAITNNTPWTPNTGQWYHVAMQRRQVSSNSGKFSLFVDGIEQYSVVSTAVMASIAGGVYGVSLGGDTDSTPEGGVALNGFIDEFRLSNVARYRGNFTPPGSAYPLTGLFTKDSAGTERQLDV